MNPKKKENELAFTLTTPILNPRIEGVKLRFHSPSGLTGWGKGSHGSKKCLLMNLRMTKDLRKER